MSTLHSLEVLSDPWVPSASATQFDGADCWSASRRLNNSGHVGELRERAVVCVGRRREEGTHYKRGATTPLTCRGPSDWMNPEEVHAQLSDTAQILRTSRHESSTETDPKPASREHACSSHRL
jgi:hypothetical protein